MNSSLPSPALARIAERFAARLPERLDAIDAAAAAIDTAAAPDALGDLERLLHDIAGTAPVLGYAGLGAQARATEDLVVALRTGTGRPGVDTVEALFTQVQALRTAAHLQGDGQS